MRLLVILAASLALLPAAAQAYVGPGLGAGAIGAILGILGAALLAVFAVVYYPIKRAIRGRRPANAANTSPQRSDVNPDRSA